MRRFFELETALLDAQNRAALLQKQLHAVETSTSWRLTGPLRRILSRVQPERPIPPSPHSSALSRPEPPTYDQWIESSEPTCLANLATSRPGNRQVASQRLGVVLLPGPQSATALARLVASCPPECCVLVLDAGHDPALAGMASGDTVVTTVPAGFQAADAPKLAIELLDADLLCFLDPQDRLAEVALRLAVLFAGRFPQADILFADEDWLTEGRRTQPFLKPGWDCELQRCRDLLGPFSFFRSALVRQVLPVPGPAWLYGLANQVIAATRPERIQHIPAVLCHRVARVPAASLQAAARVQLRREGIAARIEPASRDRQRLIYDLPTPPPRVSVIVPTKDHPELLATCTDALLHRTDYLGMEVLIVDNGTVQADALSLLDRLATDRRVRVLRHPGPFNWSRLNNHAAQVATSEVLLLLNNDIDVLHPDWLSILVSHAIQPGVGAVGAKLLYPDGRIQHAGLTTDLTGVPRHLFRFEPGDSGGPFGLMDNARQVWGVTGACLAIARSVFNAVGGLNEALPVVYNDVDLCLRLTAHGYRIVWTPWASLEHRELATRVPDHLPERREQAQEELDRLVRDWGGLVLHDPFLNANLHVEKEQACFGVAVVP